MDRQGRFSFSARMLQTLALCAVAVPTGSAQAQTIGFKDGPLGALPDAFESLRTGHGSVGDWKIVADATAEGGRALAQTSTDQTDDRFPIAVYRPVSVKDAEIAIHFKPVAGKVDQAGGIAWRLQSGDDYYLVRANALEDNVRIYRVVKGRRETIGGKNIKVAPREWHTLAVKAQGEEFTVFYEGQPLFTIGDRTFLNAGKVALWTKADSVTHFDRIDIRKSE